MNIPIAITITINIILLTALGFLSKKYKRSEKSAPGKLSVLIEKTRDLEQEVYRQSVIISDYKERLQLNPKVNEFKNEPVHQNDNEDELNAAISEKQKLEAEKEAFKQKTQKLWEQSIAVYKEKDRIDSLRKFIESKHNHLTQSIGYAQRIQRALLPTDELLNTLLPDFFILYRPRDIVSGDFYWIKQLGSKIVLIAADCTGHGVPGAFMSLLGISHLNEIVSLYKEISAASVLEIMREKIKATFNDVNGNIRITDGMDMVVCIFDPATKTLEFSGANNNILIARSDKTLIELKGTRNPVSYFLKEKPFENQVINLEPNEYVFLFSDGYFDQFGEKAKDKIKRSQFKKIIEGCILDNLPLKEYNDRLVSFLEDWQGNENQIDDIMVFGVNFYTNDLIQ